jgi:hypothetical protein
VLCWETKKDFIDVTNEKIKIKNPLTLTITDTFLCCLKKEKNLCIFWISQIIERIKGSLHVIRIIFRSNIRIR